MFLISLFILMPLGAVCLDLEKWRKIAACFRGGIHDTDRAITKAAQLWMDVDPAQLERGLSGESSFDVRRFGMLEDEFWPNLSIRLFEQFGLPARFKAALKMLPVVDSLKKEA